MVCTQGVLWPKPLILSSDTRQVNLETEEIASEQARKIFRVCSRVAVGIVGNAGVAWLLKEALDNCIKGSSQYAVEHACVADFCKVIDINEPGLFEYCHQITDQDIGGAVMVAGCNEACLPVIQWKRFGQKWTEINPKEGALGFFIFPPLHTTMEQCNQIFLRHLSLNKQGWNIDLLQTHRSTISEISTLTASINDVADIWTLTCP